MRASFPWLRRGLLVVAPSMVLLAQAAPAGALARCKAKVDTTAKATGEIRVTASGVSGPVFWGTSAGKELEPCQPARKGNACPLGPSGSLAAATAPATCRLFLKDGAGSCAVTVVGCSPGVRIRDASFAADDPRVESVSLEDDGGTLRFTGVNVQIVNGSGATDGAVNGRGNLIVGYNEPRICSFGPGVFLDQLCQQDSDCPAGLACVEREHTGSHNVVVTAGSAYSSYGGIVAGRGNWIGAPFATVTGGSVNRAIAEVASVTGGNSNVAGGYATSVAGGFSNFAQGSTASVAGGEQNQATGLSAAVSGGNLAVASGFTSWVGGGKFNTAGGNFAAVAGGKENSAAAEASTAVGGVCNLAGPGAVKDPSFCSPGMPGGFAAATFGGWRNDASGSYAAVSGGQQNVASGGSSSVGGGDGVVQANGLGWSAGSAGAAVTGKFSSP